jgi:hypothetical protein
VRAVIVVPSIRERNVQEFLDAWEGEFAAHTVIVVEDNPERSFKLPSWVRHVAHKEIDENLGEDAWIIPRKTGGIRSYGALLAGGLYPDMIVMLDDDCLPDEPRFLETHWNMLETPGDSVAAFDTLKPAHPGNNGIRPRGYPKKIQPSRTVLNHGVWNKVPDIDGETQLRFPHYRSSFPKEHTQVISSGTLFPMSAMNVAFRPKLLPAMYQMPMGEGQPYHRFDDIWCGLIMKKACDVLGWSVRSGSPAIKHMRASNAEVNARVEATGVAVNDQVWRVIAGAHVAPDDLSSVVSAIHDELTDAFENDYWSKVDEASLLWRAHVRKHRETTVA